MNKENQDIVFAKTAMEIGFVSQKDIDSAKENQRIDEIVGESKSLSEYFLASGALTAEQIADVLNFLKENSNEFIAQQYEQRLAAAIGNFSPVFQELPAVKKYVIPKSGQCTLKSWLWITGSTFIGSILGFFVGILLSPILPFTSIAFYLVAMVGTRLGAHFGGQCRNNMKYVLALVPTALLGLSLSLIFLNTEGKDNHFAAIVYFMTPWLLYYYCYAEDNFCENCNTGFEEKELFVGEDISPNKVLDFLEKKLFPLEEPSILKTDTEFPCHTGQVTLRVVGNMCPVCHSAVVNAIVDVSIKNAMAEGMLKRLTGKSNQNKTLVRFIVGFFGLVMKFIPGQHQNRPIQDSSEVVIYSELWSGKEVDLAFKPKTANAD